MSGDFAAYTEMLAGAGIKFRTTGGIDEIRYRVTLDIESVTADFGREGQLLRMWPYDPEVGR